MGLPDPAVAARSRILRPTQPHHLANHQPPQGPAHVRRQRGRRQPPAGPPPAGSGQRGRRPRSIVASPPVRAPLRGGALARSTAPLPRGALTELRPPPCTTPITERNPAPDKFPNFPRV